MVACVTWFMHCNDPILDPRSAMLAVLDYRENDDVERRENEPHMHHADFIALKPCVERLVDTHRRTIVPAFTKRRHRGGHDNTQKQAN